jgi:hypothetical protein
MENSHWLFESTRASQKTLMENSDPIKGGNVVEPIVAFHRNRGVTIDFASRYPNEISHKRREARRKSNTAQDRARSIYNGIHKRDSV